MVVNFLRLLELFL